MKRLLSKSSIVFVMMSIMSSLVQAQEPSVTWVTPPPQTVQKGQSFPVAWNVDALPGSFHALCTFCPESLGPNCKKGAPRQDTQMISGSDRGLFSANFKFDAQTEPGNYYAVGYGAYGAKSHYGTKPILISYAKGSATSAAAQSSTTEIEQGSSSSSSTTVVVNPAPVAPAYGWWGWVWGAASTTGEGTTTANQEAAEQQSAANQSQRQDAASSNQQQRQETSTTNQQQRQDSRTPEQQSSAQSSNHQGNSSHQQGSHGASREGGRGARGGSEGHGEGRGGHGRR